MFYWMARFYTEVGPPVMAASLYGDGRAIVIGDGSLFDNRDHDGDHIMSLYEYDNEKLAVNIMDWLCERCLVQLPHLVNLTSEWLAGGPSLAADLNESGHVDLGDFG